MFSLQGLASLYLRVLVRFLVLELLSTKLVACCMDASFRDLSVFADPDCTAALQSPGLRRRGGQR